MQGSMSDNEVVKKLNRVESGLFAILGNALDTAASERAAKRTGGVGDRDADFLDNPRNVRTPCSSSAEALVATVPHSSQSHPTSCVLRAISKCKTHPSNFLH